MSLRDIQYQEDYRSGYDDVVDDFFAPSLREAKIYWRAVGYFSSSALESLGAPLVDFIRNGGHIRLVTSVQLSEADIKAIHNGAVKQDICAQRVEQIIENDFADGIGDGVIRLVRLLEIGRLEIQIAVPNTGSGIYHEKIGLFIDGEDFVAFSGSTNESRTAFEKNRECIDVYTSWKSMTRAHRKKKHFETLWERRDHGVEVYSFPQAATKKLLRVCSEWKIELWNQPQRKGNWRHQDEALSIFLAKERGILDMATGTGKTRTAIKIMQELFDRNLIDTVIICTNSNDILDQWYFELLHAQKTVESAPRIFRHYRNSKEQESFTLNPKNAILLVSRNPLAPALRKLNANHNQAQRTLLIHDEVHGLGSPSNRSFLAGLSTEVRFRLGLSATPGREYDQEGNAFIEQHIGPVLFTFGLREAIERGILAPFNYFPLTFEPTDYDRERITSIYRKRKAREEAGKPMSETEMWIEISNVYKTSEAKLPVFAEFIRNHKDLLTRSIIFTETMEYGDSVLEIVHRYRADFHTYFSGEDEGTLKNFAQGNIECLIACHRLSEGIDIQSLNTVILFSSAKARLETIQRIGRCLRVNPNDPGKFANIVDFIRESSDRDNPTADEERRNWLTELSKVRMTR